MVDLLVPILQDARVGPRAEIGLDVWEQLGQLEAVPSQSVQKYLQSLIGPAPLANFVYDEILRDVGRAFSSAEHMPLVEVPGFSDVRAFATRMIEALEVLPRSYRLSLEMPPSFARLFSRDRASVVLADGVALELGTKLLSEDEGSQSPPRIKVFPPLSDGTIVSHSSEVHLHIEFKGYATSHGMTDSLADAIDEAKAILGSMIAHGLLRYWPIRISRSPPAFAVHTREGVNVGTLVQSGELPEGFAFASAGELMARNNRVWRGAGELGEDVDTILRRIGVMLEKNGDQRLHGNLVLGSKWLLDSYVGHDKVMSYVQATVALETMLGDKAQSDVMGIGALLGNRCAYLIAKSVDERHELLKAFKAIYDVRSRIVHRGQSRLTTKEQDSLAQLHSICGRVIASDTELLSPLPRARART